MEKLGFQNIVGDKCGVESRDWLYWEGDWTSEWSVCCGEEESGWNWNWRRAGEMDGSYEACKKELRMVVDSDGEGKKDDGVGGWNG